MFHLKAFKTEDGYQVTNGPIVIELSEDFFILQSNIVDTVVKDYARGLAVELARAAD